MIQSFDAATQSATVAIAALRNVIDRTTNPPQYVPRPYPLLTDVPVFVHSGGNSGLLLPVQAGDTCLVLFNDRDIDNWWTTGSTTVPNSARLHSMSDGFALVGFRSKANLIANYPTDRAKLFYEESALELAAKVKLYNGDASLKSVLDSIITALTALNAKTGPSAATQITAAQTEVNKLTE